MLFCSADRRRSSFLGNYNRKQSFLTPLGVLVLPASLCLGLQKDKLQSGQGTPLTRSRWEKQKNVGFCGEWPPVPCPAPALDSPLWPKSRTLEGSKSSCGLGPQAQGFQSREMGILVQGLISSQFYKLEWGSPEVAAGGERVPDRVSGTP